MSTGRFQPMPDDFEPTRATLHQYANAIGVIPRLHAPHHERWWHASLKVTERGLETDRIDLPSGSAFNLRLDLVDHEVVVEADGYKVAGFAMGAGLTGTQMGDAVIAAVAELGLEGDYAREKFESTDPREYEAPTATTYFEILAAIHDVFAVHRDRLPPEVGILQVWPHGFDLAFEWFGSRIEEYEEHGTTKQLPAQCNFGFYPAGRAYFYANPWPFQAETLLAADLHGDAAWHTEGWQGSELFYDQLAGADWRLQILDFFGEVFAVAEPTLRA